jgi:peptide/nickel transport system ATP-binding protein
MAEVSRLLSLVNLDGDRAAVLPRTLSGGQRQRVALARALAARPDVIVADEITAALDVSVQGTVLNLVRDLQRELDLSMLFISHNMAVVRYVSDIIAVMFRGRIVEIGPTASVLDDPQHPYTRELLDAVPTQGRSLLSPEHTDELLPSHAPSQPIGSERGGCAFADRCPVGPRFLDDRQICLDSTPSLASVAKAHDASCHFVRSADERMGAWTHGPSPAM